MGWDIRISKKFVPSSLIKECDRIPLVEWQRYVDNDKELMWEENSPIARVFKAEGHDWVKEENLKKCAYYDFNYKKNWPGLRFCYSEGTISVSTERSTLKRVEKMWQVAEYFDVYLFKSGIRFTEKKLEKLRRKSLTKGTTSKNKKS